MVQANDPPLERGLRVARRRPHRQERAVRPNLDVRQLIVAAGTDVELARPSRRAVASQPEDHAACGLAVLARGVTYYSGLVAGPRQHGGGEVGARTADAPLPEVASLGIAAHEPQ